MDSTGWTLSKLPSSQNRLTTLANHLSSATRHKVVVTRNLGPDAMPILQQRPDLDLVVWPKDTGCDWDWLMENIPGSEGVLIMFPVKANEELVTKAGPSLKVVSTMSVGYEHIDLKALARRNIKLGYTPDVLTDAVADVSIMLALMAGRNGKEIMSVVDKGQWPTYPWSPFAFCGVQLSATPTTPTRTAGFLGFGRIAQATLARLVPFGITHCLFTSNPASRGDPAFEAALAQKHGLRAVRRVDLAELARESDVLFVLAPGGAETLHIVDEAFLRQMKKTSVLVNTSRGSLVDSDALAKALKESWIWGAGLDVVEGEPNVTIDHPLVKEPRCVILPHVGSATVETRQAMATLAARNVLAGVLGDKMPAELDLSGRS